MSELSREPLLLDERARFTVGHRPKARTRRLSRSPLLMPTRRDPYSRLIRRLREKITSEEGDRQTRHDVAPRETGLESSADPRPTQGIDEDSARMRCPFCTGLPSSVLQTTRPLDEGLDYGDIKRRLRKCGACSKNFTTFEIQESLFRRLSIRDPKLRRQPLSIEEDRQPKKKEVTDVPPTCSRS